MKKHLPKLVGTYLNAAAHVVPRHVGRLGFRLFCRPLRAPLKPHHEVFLDSADDFSFVYNGLRIRGYRWGSGGANILLLHGWQSHSARWKAFVEAFPKDEYTVYAFDAPGHGRSEGSYFTGPLYGEIIHHVGREIEPLRCVIGHSIGAFSMLYALSTLDPLSIERAVVMAAPGNVSDFVAYYQKKMGLTARSMELIRAHFEQEIGKPYEYFTLSRFARSLDLPALIVHDREDRQAPLSYAERLEQAWEASTLIPTSGLGHNLRSPHVVEQVRHFVERGHPRDFHHPSGEQASLGSRSVRTG